MSSFKQLTKDGVLKRADAFKVKYQDIVVEEGFNTRDEGERLDEHVQAIFQFIMDGGQLPPLEVVPTTDGKVKVRDGHCRHRAYGMAIDAGAPVEWIEVKQFLGNDVDQVARIVTSNEGLKLTPLETARVYKRLRGYGLGPEEIAKKVGKSRQHVDQLLILADAPHKVQKLVADGAVSATEAMKLTREHGEGAANILEDKARATGGKKITAKALKPWTPPAKIALGVVDEVQAFLDGLEAPTHMALSHLRAYPEAEDREVPVSGKALLALFEEMVNVHKAKNKHADRQRQQAEDAAQTDIEDAA